nr:hypothetical protein [Vibrio cidicii]
MDTVKTQLKKDFYSQIYSLQSSAVSQSTSTLAVLTEEETQRAGSRMDRVGGLEEKPNSLRSENGKTSDEPQTFVWGFFTPKGCLGVELL